MNYIVLGRIRKPEKTTVKTGEALLDSIVSVNKRIKKRTLLPFRLAYGNEVNGLFQHATDAINAMVFLEEELMQSGVGPIMHWSICSGAFTLMKDEKRNPIVGGRELPLLRQTLQREGTKNRFFVRTHDREDDFFLLQGLYVWDHLMGGWNLKKDNEILGIFLEGNDYKYAAEALNIARPQTWRKYRSLQMPAYFSIREILLSGRLLAENNVSGDLSLQINKP
jgi:hypothetical protein